MTQSETQSSQPASGDWLLVAIAWTLVGVPLAWGIWKTLSKALILFQ